MGRENPLFENPSQIRSQSHELTLKPHATMPGFHKGNFLWEASVYPESACSPLLSLQPSQDNLPTSQSQIVSTQQDMGTSASAPEQNAEASGRAHHSEGKEPTRIIRKILKEASVQSPLAAAPCHGVFEHYSGSKGLQKHFFRTYKQKDEILERIRAQDRFATPQEERGLICWRGHKERRDRDEKGAVKYAWLNSHARIGFLVSAEWILHIECVNPSKKTSVSGFSTSGAFVQIRRYLHNPIDPNDGNLDIQGRSTSTNLGEMSVRINDVPIEINVRVGPLPSYAVIQINNSSVFWWRTQEALNFVPKVGDGEIQSLSC